MRSDLMVITDKKQLDDAISYAMHSLYLEGFNVTADVEKNVRAVLTGQLSMKELLEKIKDA